MEHTHHAHTPRNDYGRFIATIMLFCLLAAAGYALQHTISCFLLSWVIAYLLDPLLVSVEQRGMKRLYALGLLYVILGVLTVFFMAFILPAITISWNSFILDLPSYILKLKQLALEWKSLLPDRYGSDEIQWLLDKASGNVDKAAEKAGLWVYGFGTRIFFNLFNIVLSPILVFFMLYYKQTVIDTVTSWLPDGRRDQIIDIAHEVNNSIGGYLRGQVMVSIIVALLATVALFILGIPHPIFCGAFAGAASILPFIGVIIATLPALFFAWFKFQSAAMLGQTTLAFGLIYFVEGYVIKPLVFKESMNLNPLVTIIMVMALGEILGFWGILLALPIASAIKITWGHFVRGDFKQR
ncbi:MAG: AI-2E family transporter [Pelobacteraceae bacterium]